MLEINVIRENKEEVIRRLAVKNYKAEEIIGRILDLDTRRRETQKKNDDILAESNRISKEIGILFKSGKAEEAARMKEQTTDLKKKGQELGELLSKLITEMEDLLMQVPNMPHPGVPGGRSAEDNEKVFQEGEEIQLDDRAVPHWDLISRYNIIDFELGNKVTGAGFPFYRGKGARIQRALINFFLDEAIKAGYTEYQPPLMVNEDSAFGTGQLPDKDGQMYSVPEDKLFLIPTAEVPITNIYRNMILQEDELPVKNAAYSSCFRREAGSWGKEVRGLNRLHQFDKVEIVRIEHPSRSYEALEEMREYVAGLLRKLDLPFRILKLCGGDLSFTSALTYDFEVWSAAQKRWLEVSSVSNFETFQSNRMKLRIKDKNGKTFLAHTLNGSALALPRILAALLENNQTPGGVIIPEILRSYTGFDRIG
ncbi:MAG: serine--tRNA ligase [Bacteroidetes bacterium]|nr:serine--tRNA ligase [Bacteroidota bacterium]